MAIRDATPDDVGGLADLAVRTFRDTYRGRMESHDIEAHVADAFSREAIAAAVDAPADRILLAEADRRAVGYAILRPGGCVRLAGPSLQLVNLYVDRTQQRSGVGGALLHASIAAARDGGCAALWLTVWEHNGGAIAFYRHHGFRAVGETAFVVGADAQRDVVMTLDLRVVRLRNDVP